MKTQFKKILPNWLVEYYKLKIESNIFKNKQIEETFTYINENKYSAKGHNRAEITKQLFLDVLLGNDCITTRMSPDKFLLYNEITKVVNSGVAPFSEHTRRMNATYNKLKKRVGNVFVGPVIINIYQDLSLTVLMRESNQSQHAIP